MPARHKLALFALAASLAAAAGPALPAMDPDPVDALSARDADFARGRKAIEARDWNTAIKALLAAEQRDSRNADIQNLLGFAYRNSGQLDAAFKHYQRALQIDPRHRGAHEYLGEAYLMAKNPAKAEEQLAALKKVCPGVCEEYDDLKKKIDAYRAQNK